MNVLLIAGSSQILNLQNRTKMNKIDEVVEILNRKNPNPKSNLMIDLTKTLICHQV
jgi:hypothetical protein